GGVYVITDRWRGDHLARVGIHHRHDLAAASDEESTIFTIHGHAAGRVADLPALVDGQLLRVDFEHHPFIFEVVEDVSLSVGDGEFRTAAQINCAGDFPFLGFDDGSAVAAAVECEDPRGRGIEQNGIRLLAGGYVRDLL